MSITSHRELHTYPVIENLVIIVKIEPINFPCTTSLDTCEHNYQTQTQSLVQYQLLPHRPQRLTPNPRPPLYVPIYFILYVRNIPQTNSVIPLQAKQRTPLSICL